MSKQIKNMNDSELISLIQNHNNELSQRAIDLIFVNYKQHIKMLANKYYHLGLSNDDLFSEGCIGLLKAIEKFNPKKNASFKTYSTFWIKQAMIRSIENQSRTIRIPCNSARQIRQYHNSYNELKQQYNREPTRKELMEKLNFSEDVLNRVSTANVVTYSLNSKISDSGSELKEVISENNHITPECLMIQKDSFMFLEKHINALHPNENTVIKLRFGLDIKKPKTLRYISDKLGLSIEKIRQIELATIRKLKKLIENDIDNPELLMVS